MLILEENGRGEGIRTLGSLRYTRVPGVLLRPLGHPSVKNSGFCMVSLERKPFKTHHTKCLGGRGTGIRTLGGVTLNGFQDRRFRPLSHPPIFSICH